MVGAGTGGGGEDGESGLWDDRVNLECFIEEAPLTIETGGGACSIPVEGCPLVVGASLLLALPLGKEGGAMSIREDLGDS
jgi:hypothetical protein